MKYLRIALFLASLLAVAPAVAQDDVSTPDAIALRNQILQLQAQVNALQAAQNANQNGDQGSGAPSSLAAPVPLSGSGAPPAPASTPNSDLLPELVTRISTLEDQVRSLTGQVQDLTNQLQQQNQSFTKQIGDINFQLQGGTGAAPNSNAPAAAAPGAASPAPATAPPNAGAPTSLNTAGSGFPVGTLGTLPADQAQPAPAPAAAPAAPTAQDTLQDGIDALSQKHYSVAAKDARLVLATDSASPAGYDAQFLLARALAGRGDWEHAAVAYDDTYTRARYGSHSQDAQLGEARALLALGDNGAACGALNRLTKQYATPRADLRPEIARVHARACGA